MSSSELKKDLLKELMPELKCYKCQSLPSNKSNARFKCIFEAHSICQDCFNNFKRCLCGSNLTAKPCKLNQALLDFLPKSCQNVNHGCKEIFENGGELENHEENCVYRLIPCPFDSCDQKRVKFIDFIEHFKAHDGNHIIWDQTQNNSFNGELEVRMIEAQNGAKAEDSSIEILDVVTPQKKPVLTVNGITATRSPTNFGVFPGNQLKSPAKPGIIQQAIIDQQAKRPRLQASTVFGFANLKDPEGYSFGTPMRIFKEGLNQDFILQTLEKKGSVCFFLTVVGSKEVAKNIEWSIQIQDIDGKDKFSYKGITSPQDCPRKVGLILDVETLELLLGIKNEVRNLAYTLKIRNLKEDAKDDLEESGISE